MQWGAVLSVYDECCLLKYQYTLNDWINAISRILIHFQHSQSSIHKILPYFHANPNVQTYFQSLDQVIQTASHILALSSIDTKVNGKLCKEEKQG